MKLIVAVDKNWGIGRDGKLLFHLPEDLRFFKEKTLNKTVIMGRKTLESLPYGKPLPNRQNIVLSKSNVIESKDNLIVVKSYDELFRVINSYNSDEVFVIGGAIIYNKLYKFCDELYVTKIDEDGKADTYIENLDKDNNFVIKYSSNWYEHKGIKYKFTTYAKKS